MKKIKKQNIDKFNYIIKIAEFIIKTGNNVANRLENEFKVTNVKLKN